MEYNKIFRNHLGVKFIYLPEFAPKNPGINWLQAVDGQVMTCRSSIPCPVSSLINEIGQEYHVVNLHAHAVLMAEKHGVYQAVKRDEIRVWKGSVPIMEFMLNPNYKLKLAEGEYPAQHIYDGSFFAVTDEELQDKYRFVQNDMEAYLYKPQDSEVTQWVYSDVNLIVVNGGNLEFLTTPMINIATPGKPLVYDYADWWGSKNTAALYKTTGYYCADKVKYYPEPMAAPVAATLTSIQTLPELLFDKSKFQT